MLAQPDSFTYRCRKFIRRNRVAVTFSVLLIGMLVAGIIGTSYQTIRANSSWHVAEQAQQDADREAQTAKDVLEFFVLDMIRAADPSVDGHDVKVFDLLSAAESTIDERFARQPEIQSTLRQVLGQTYTSLGLLPEALEQFQLAYTRGREILGPDDPQTLQSMVSVGGALDGVGRLDDAASQCRSVLGRVSTTTLRAQSLLCETLQSLGRYEEAEPHLLASYEGLREFLGEERNLTERRLDNVFRQQQANRTSNYRGAILTASV